MGQLSLAPEALTFGNVDVGAPGVSKNITLTSTGTAPLVISSIFVKDSEDYSQTNDCGSSIPVGASCTITVTFTPTTAGIDNAAVEFVTSAPNHVQDFYFGGTGVVSLSTSVSPSSLSFAVQQVGATSSSQAVTISNTGTGAATFASPTITGPNAADFHWSDSCGPVIQVSGSCAIAVTYSPVSAGASNASLVILDNSASSPHTVALLGSGSDFAVNGPSGADAVSAGQSANFQISLTTTGGPTVNTTAFSASGNPANTTVTFDPTTIPSGTSSGSVTMTVTTITRAALLWERLGVPPSILLLLSVLSVLALVVDLLAFRGAHATRKPRYVLAAQIVFLILFAASCGGGGGSTGGGTVPQVHGTPAGTYTITVTATSGSVARSTSVTLVVQ